MLICAEDSHVIFECEICAFKTRVPIAARKNRTFMRHFNDFKRNHEWTCRIRKDKNDKIDLAKKTAADIIKQLQEAR